MKILLIVIFIAALTGAENVRRHRRVVDGKKAGATQFPYQVSLRLDSNIGYVCGGSIIHKQFVLTAAHCVYGIHIDDIYIVAGTESISSSRKSYRVDLIIIAEEYDTISNIDDIALIKIKNKFQFSTYVQKIALPSLPTTRSIDKYPPAGGTMTISGFGRTRRNSTTSRTLQYAEVTLISMKECLDASRDVITSYYITYNHLCTLDQQKRICYGDSGGPLVYDGKQVGIVSWAINPCADGYPDIYVRVTSYVNWIENKIKKYTQISDQGRLQDLISVFTHFSVYMLFYN